jgi:hypothetical protein
MDNLTKGRNEMGNLMKRMKQAEGPDGLQARHAQRYPDGCGPTWSTMWEDCLNRLWPIGAKVCLEDWEAR